MTDRPDGLADACTWGPPCAQPAEHPVWHQPRLGLIVHETVCGRHLTDAARHGYRTDTPPVPPPDLN